MRADAAPFVPSVAVATSSPCRGDDADIARHNRNGGIAKKSGDEHPTNNTATRTGKTEGNTPSRERRRRRRRKQAGTNGAHFDPTPDGGGNGIDTEPTPSAAQHISEEPASRNGAIGEVRSLPKQTNNNRTRRRVKRRQKPTKTNKHNAGSKEETHPDPSSFARRNTSRTHRDRSQRSKSNGSTLVETESLSTNVEESYNWKQEFPALLSETNEQHQSADTNSNAPRESSAVWTTVAAGAHTRELMQKAKKLKEETANRNSSTASAWEKLTRLGSCRVSKSTQNVNVDLKDDDTDIDQNSDILILEQGTKTSPEPVSSLIFGGSARFNIGKLRDRWWEILRDKQNRDKEKEQLDLLQESNQQSTSSSEDEELATSVSSSTSSESSESSTSTSLDDPSLSSDDGSCSSDEDLYTSTVSPLHAAIYNDDITALTRLLALPQTNDFFLGLDSFHMEPPTPPLLSADTTAFSPLQFAIFLDRPHLIKVILDSDAVRPSLSTIAADKYSRTPLMLASELGRDGCVKVLLSYSVRLAAKDDLHGNTVLHFCCKGGDPTSLKLLLGASGASKGSSNHQRLVCSKNKLGQTALHVACKEGRTHLVETFLSTCASGASSKALQMEDSDGRTPLLSAVEAGCTNVVMHLLMWRGNHQMGNALSTKTESAKFYAPKHLGDSTSMRLCPMVLAASNGSVEMIQLLLEFGDPSASAASFSYNLDLALYKAVNFLEDFPATIRTAMIRLLIEAGANPHASVRPHTNDGPLLYNNNDVIYGSTSLDVVACRGDLNSLNAILETSHFVLASQRAARRQDPNLQQQPESYFDALESRERAEIQASLQDTLVRSLFLGWKNSIQQQDPSTENHSSLLASVQIFKTGIQLDNGAFVRLEKSLITNTLQGQREVAPYEGSYCYQAEYTHYEMQGDKIIENESPYDSSSAGWWSIALLNLGWVWPEWYSEGNFCCRWMRDHRSRATQQNNYQEHILESDECYMIVEDSRLLVHRSIISCKCAKLDAAFRFAELSNTDDSNDKVCIEVNISLSMCKLLVQHCYHGSIVSGLSSDALMCCNELLELALVAEEFLCPSLVKECEMRILAKEPRACVCWNYATLSKKTNTVQSKKKEGHAFSDEQLCFTVDSVAATCMYHVSSPPAVLKADNALDVLAVAQQVSYVDDSGNDMWIRVCSNNRFGTIDVSQPFVVVRAAAVRVIMQQFGLVLKSDSYFSQLQPMCASLGNKRSDVVKTDHEDVMAMLLLQTCLDEIAQTPLTKTPTPIEAPSTTEWSAWEASHFQWNHK
eukprot:scaffold10034_cov53-Attheya_sp.AAC.6